MDPEIELYITKQLTRIERNAKEEREHLTDKQREEIRKYLLAWVSLPAIGVAILTLIVGFFSGKIFESSEKSGLDTAYNEALKTLDPGLEKLHTELGDVEAQRINAIRTSDDLSKKQNEANAKLAVADELSLKIEAKNRELAEGT
jgi:hypothetical protein